MEKVSADAMNTAFSEMMDSPDGRAEVQEAGLTYIKQKLREESFTRKIIPPVNVTKYDTQRAVDSDTVEKIVDIEPDSEAMALTFRDEPNARFIRGPRYRVPFFTISSELYEKTEEELFAYEMPVVKVVQDNSVKDIQEEEDERFLTYCGLAVAQTGQVIQLPGKARLDEKTMLTDLFSEIDANRLITDKILMAQTTFNDVIGLPTEQLGDGMNSEVVKDGFSYNIILGKKLIVTTKTNLVSYGQVWSFAQQKYLGNFYILGNTKFWINKRANLLEWQAWETIGLGIGNVRGVAKLEYGEGVVTP
jgi:hypothetical protein